MTEWVDVATGVVISTGSTTDVASPGTYLLTEANHCGIASDTIVIDFESAPPAFDLGQDMVICPGDTVFLNAPQTDNVILWETPSGASTGSEYVATQQGLIMLTISNDCGTFADDVLIAFDENAPKIVLDPVSLCDGESVVLDVTQPFEALYEWNTGSTSPMIEIATPGSYSVSIITECYSLEEHLQVSYSGDCDPQIFIPNVFSPNGDGVNDVWEVFVDPSIDVIGIECNVFDRWGNTVFGARALPISWDGKFNEQALQPGVYVYVVKLIHEKDSQIHSGSLTLVR
jgi:gliding motility-associated-like protein